MELFFIFYVAIMLVVGTYVVAKRYNRNHMAWTISALFFGGIFVLPLLLIVGKNEVA